MRRCFAEKQQKVRIHIRVARAFDEKQLHNGPKGNYIGRGNRPHETRSGDDVQLRVAFKTRAKRGRVHVQRDRGFKRVDVSEERSHQGEE